MEKNNSAFMRRWLGAILALALTVLLILAFFTLWHGISGRLLGDFCYPYRRLTRLAADRVSDQSLLAYDRTELIAKLEHLQQENRRLALQAATAAEFWELNAKLRQLNHLPKLPKWRFVECEILLRDPLLWNQRFTITGGREDGIEAGAAVLDVTPDGRPVLVGIVEEVQRRSSVVVTIANPALRLSVKFSTSGGVGFLNTGTAGQRLNCIPVGHLSRELNFCRGEAVVTTGFERNIPGSVLIGELDKLDSLTSQYSEVLELSGLIRPAVQFNELRFLRVAVRKLNL